MPVFQKILFPVDFSDACREIASQVKAFASQLGAEVTLLHVVSMPTLEYGPASPMDPDFFPDWTELQTRAQVQLDDFLTADFAGPRVHRVVHRGDPARAISAYARNEGMDLIMMPTHGLGAFRRLLLGSVTAKVLHDAVCPVWTGIHTKGGAPATTGKTLLCALDLNSSSVAILQRAVRLAEDLHLEPRVLHAIPAHEAAAGGKPGPFREFLFSVAREGVAKIQSQAGTDLPVCIRGGSVAHVVHDAAAEHKAGLVVIGRGHLPRMFGELRTHAYAIIAQCPSPVISL